MRNQQNSIADAVGYTLNWVGVAECNDFKALITRQLSYRKMTARCALYVGACPENFREFLSTPTVTLREIFNGLLFRLIL